MKFKVSNNKDIEKLIQIIPQDIKELTVDVKNINILLDGLLEDLDDWPLAVTPSLIIDVNNKSKCEERAKNIIDVMIEQDLHGLKVLDFGCGDGTVAKEMLNRGAQVVGYDIKSHDFWLEQIDFIKQVQFKTDIQELINSEPFDLILLYDVLDHIMEDPIPILLKLNNLLKNDGILIVRNHPWISRHGTHLYTQFNRAFAHVIFDESKLSYISTPTRKIVHPMLTYNGWFKKSGFKVVKEDKIMSSVEDFFMESGIFKSLIQRHFYDSPMEEYREGRGDLSKILGFHFVDFCLKKG